MIILASNGMHGLITDEFEKLIREKCDGKPVLVITNCADENSANFSNREIVKSNFEKFGASEVVLKDITKNNTADILNFQVIYVMGGQIQNYLELINSSDFKEKLMSFLNNGGVYIGESAGAICMGFDAKWYFDVNKGEKPKYDLILNSFRGLNLSSLNIFPHYNKCSLEKLVKINNYEKEHGIEITGLDDGNFIIIEYNAG